MASAGTRRHTRQRQTILEELRSVKTHPTAADLFELVRRRLPRISLGTVYRNLEVLVGDGLAVKLPASGHESRYDGRCSSHAHLHCETCGRIDDVDDPMPDIEALATIDLDGFTIRGYSLMFHGRCPRCRGESSVSSN